MEDRLSPGWTVWTMLSPEAAGGDGGSASAGWVASGWAAAGCVASGWVTPGTSVAAG